MPDNDFCLAIDIQVNKYLNIITIKKIKITMYREQETNVSILRGFGAVRCGIYIFQSSQTTASIASALFAMSEAAACS